MSSSGLITINFQIMTNDNNNTKPAITYSGCYAQVFSRLFFGDCLIESDKIETGSVDLILTDLPYGNMNDRFKWIKDWRYPEFFPERLKEPERLKKPSVIFVGSMCDIFSDEACQ